MASEKKISVVVGANISDYVSAMNRVQAVTNKTMNDIEKRSGRARKAIAGIGAGITGLSGSLPVLAALGVGAMGLGASFAAAGAGVVGFGAVATTVLGDVFEASEELSKAQEELMKADTVKERTKALEKQKEALKGLSAEQQKAALALQDFKSFWQSFAQSFEKPVVGIFTSSLSILQGVLTNLKPAIEGSMVAIQGLVEGLNKGLQTQEMQSFFTWLGDNAASSITAFGQMAGNTFRGVVNLLMAFAPVAKTVEGGLVGLTERFANWSATLSSSQGFQQFMNYAKANAPLVAKVIGDIVSSVGNLLVGLAPLGGVVLKLLSVLTSLVNIITSALKPVLAGIGQVLDDVFSAIQSKSSTFVSWFKSLWGGLGGLGESFGRIFESVKGIVMPLIDEVVTFFQEKFAEIQQFWAQYGSQISQAIKNAFSVLATIVEFLSPVVSWIAGTLLESIKGAFNGIINVIKGFILIFTGIFTGDFTTLWEGVKSLFVGAIEAIWNIMNLLFVGRILKGISSLAQGAMAGIKGMWNALVSIFQSAGATISSKVKSLWDGVVATFNFFRSTGLSIFQSFRGTVSVIWQAIKSNVVNLAKGLWTGAKNAFNSLLNSAKSIFNNVKSAITNPIESARKTVVGIIDKIKGAFSRMKITIPKPKLPHVKVGMASRKVGPISVPYPTFSVDWYAKGGIATGASIVGVGEKGSEAIVPLSQKHRMKPFAEAVADMMPDKDKNGVTINNYFNIQATIREEADIKRLAEELAQKQRILNRAGGVLSFGN